MWFRSNPSHERSSSPLVSISELAAELKIPTLQTVEDDKNATNLEVINDLKSRIYPLIKDQDQDIKQISRSLTRLKKLSLECRTGIEQLQSAREIENQITRSKTMREIAMHVDKAFQEAATEGLSVPRAPLASTNTTDPAVLEQEIRVRYSGLEELDKNLRQTIIARVEDYALEVIGRTRAPQLKGELREAMNSLATIRAGKAESRSPEWHLADDTLAALPHSPTAQVKILEQTLCVVTEAIKIERTAADLVARRSAGELREDVQKKLECADLAGALIAAKALQLGKDPYHEDLGILAGIYRRLGVQTLEFYTLRTMCLGEGLGTASDYSRFALLTAAIGVHSTAAKGCIGFLAAHNPPDPLYLDLLCEISLLSGDAQLVAQHTHLLHNGSELSKARLALHQSNWSIAAEAAYSTYINSVGHPKNSIIEQRALCIAVEATVQNTKSGLIRDNSHPAMEHIHALLTYHPPCIEGINLLRRFASKSFLEQTLKALNTSNPTYDTLILAAHHALDLKDTATATALFEDAKGKDASRTEAHCGLAALIEETNPSAAISLFRKALALSPANNDAKNGISRLEAKQLEISQSRSKELIQIKPLANIPEAIRQYARDLFSARQKSNLPISKAQVRDFLGNFGGDERPFRDLEDLVAHGSRVFKHASNAIAEMREIQTSLRPNAFQTLLRLHPSPQHAMRIIYARLAKSTASSQLHYLGSTLYLCQHHALKLDPTGEVLGAATLYKRFDAVRSEGLEIASSASSDTYAKLCNWANGAISELLEIQAVLKSELNALDTWCERITVTLTPETTAT